MNDNTELPIGCWRDDKPPESVWPLPKSGETFKFEDLGLMQAQNTDRELWREREGDYYADSIFVTEHGQIGISCKGHVTIMSLAKWHQCANVKNRRALPAI